MRKQQEIDEGAGGAARRYPASNGYATTREAQAKNAALNGAMGRSTSQPETRHGGYDDYDAAPAYQESAYEAPRRRLSVGKASWIARLAVLIVFALNVTCAIQFILYPVESAAAYGLPRTQEAGAMAAGLGVAFLMWNVTYPAVIVSPSRFRALYVVVLFQQLVGLVGESFILWRLYGTGLGSGLMAAGITRFIIFDAAGLVLMLVAFIVLAAAMRRQRQTQGAY
ncbi:MAG: hypothetical protein Q4D27_06620 [Coriobacteriia bacterium]|nr:hypothetical protein [Coriobacteriia bacterium]